MANDHETDRECRNCRYFAPLSPGHAAICFHKWRDIPWNAAVPLTGPHDTCEAFDTKSWQAMIAECGEKAP